MTATERAAYNQAIEDAIAAAETLRLGPKTVPDVSVMSYAAYNMVMLRMAIVLEIQKLRLRG